MRQVCEPYRLVVAPIKGSTRAKVEGILLSPSFPRAVAGRKMASDATFFSYGI